MYIYIVAVIAFAKFLWRIQAVFPNFFGNTGCIRPILKKSGLVIDQPTNYRPITNIGTFSKIIEKLALEQLQPFIIGST